MISFSLEGKKAVVTGGAKGLCHGIAQAYHEAGAEVVLIDILDTVADSAAAMSSEAAPVHGVRGDLTVREDLDRMYNECLELLGGRIDILLNGAGIQHRSPAISFPEDRFRKIMDVNLNSVFLLSQLAAQTMISQQYGKIINIASMTSFMGSENICAYTASKGAVAMLTKALSNEWTGQGINVNAIAPGYMATELTADIKKTNPRQYEEITNRIPAHRWGKPEDLHGLAVFLATDAAAYISGAVIPVDGGFLGK